MVSLSMSPPTISASRGSFLGTYQQQVIGIYCVQAARVDPTYASDRVAVYANALAREVGLDDDLKDVVTIGALLHDVGKLWLPSSILAKPSPLSEAEWQVIRRHPFMGNAFCRDLGLPESVCLSVRYHHERWDGRGYGAGLSGADIPLPARIIAIADSFDAMISNRPYCTAVSLDEALLRMEQGGGSQWDPELTTIFMNLVQARGLPGLSA